MLPTKEKHSHWYWHDLKLTHIQQEKADKLTEYWCHFDLVLWRVDFKETKRGVYRCSAWVERLCERETTMPSDEEEWRAFVMQRCRRKRIRCMTNSIVPTKYCFSILHFSGFNIDFGHVITFKSSPLIIYIIRYFYLHLKQDIIASIYPTTFTGFQIYKLKVWKCEIMQVLLF